MKSQIEEIIEGIEPEDYYSPAQISEALERVWFHPQTIRARLRMGYYKGMKDKGRWLMKGSEIIEKIKEQYEE